MIEAAIELIAGASPEELTLREVARRVGVNHRAAYRHFADKLSLLAAVAQQGYADLVAALRVSLEGLERATPADRVEALGLAYVAFAIDRPSHYRIMFGRRLNEDGRFPQMEELIQQAFDCIAHELAAGQQKKAFAAWPLREAVFSFWSMCHGFSNLVLTRRLRVKRTRLHEYTQRILAPFLKGLRQGP
jgi:AcrR family transcriptional regulator